MTHQGTLRCLVLSRGHQLVDLLSETCLRRQRSRLNEVEVEVCNYLLTLPGLQPAPLKRGPKDGHKRTPYLWILSRDLSEQAEEQKGKAASSV